MTKLLKYELKHTYKLNITLILFIIISGIGLYFNPFKVGKPYTYIYNFLIITIMVSSYLSIFVYHIITFNQDFMRPQGYLMMSLPIRAREFIWAKFINHLIWVVPSSLVMFFNIFNISYAYDRSITLANIDIPKEAIGILINGVSSYLLSILIIYLSIVIVSIKPSNKNTTFIKVVLSVLFINIVKLISSILAFIITFLGSYKGSLKNITMELVGDHIRYNFDIFNLFNIIINVIITLIIYVLIKYLIDKKVQI